MGFAVYARGSVLIILYSELDASEPFAGETNGRGEARWF